MHMVRQNDPGVDVKRRLPTHVAYRFAQPVDPCHEQVGAPVAQIDREKIGGARNPIASVIRHTRNMPEAGRQVEGRAVQPAAAPPTDGGLRRTPPARSLLNQLAPTCRPVRGIDGGFAPALRLLSAEPTDQMISDRTVAVSRVTRIRTSPRSAVSRKTPTRPH